MSVYKELLFGVREVERSSHRIYPDASDYGYPVFDVKGDRLLNMVKGLSERYSGKTVTERYSTGATQTITMIGIDEWETGKEFTVQFVWVTTRSDRKKNGMIGYLYVIADEPK